MSKLFVTPNGEKRRASFELVVTTKSVNGKDVDKRSVQLIETSDGEYTLDNATDALHKGRELAKEHDAELACYEPDLKGEDPEVIILCRKGGNPFLMIAAKRKGKQSRTTRTRLA